MSSVFGALIPPVELMGVHELGPVHFIAIGGAGMSGIASLYAALGVPVSGSDQADSPTLVELAAQGIRTFVGHHAEHLGDAQTVVVSSAIRAENPELVAARERGLRIWHRSAALGALMLGRTGISVAGTHGKTTTTAMIAHILNRCGADPGYVVGAPMADGRSSRLGSGPFVVEADESDGSFLQYPTEVGVITNIEADHLDNWETPENYARGFANFAAGAQTVVADIDDPGVRALAARPELERPLVTYGTGAAAGTRLTDIRAAGFAVGATLAGNELRLPVPGQHNAYNAAAAVLAAHCVGIAPKDACAALADFGGTHRRFQPIGEAGGVRVFDDYAHHPTEVAATLAAARVGVADGNGGGRIVAVFQPHLFSRTRDFAAEFGRALAAADEVVLTDIYPAREDPIPGVTSDLLAAPCREAGGSVRRCSFDEVPAAVAELARRGDVVFTLGAGDVTRLAPRIVAQLGAGGR